MSDQGAQRLGPQTAAEVLDGSLRLLRDRPATTIAVLAPFVVPIQLIAAYAQRDFLDGRPVADVYNDVTLLTLDSESTGAALATALTLGILLMAPFMAAAVALLLEASYTGADPSPGEILTTVLRRTPALLVAWVLVHVVEGAALFLLVVPAVLAMIFFSLTAPVIALERLGPIAAMKRSWRLTTKSFGRSLGLILLVTFAAELLSSTLSLPATSLALVLGARVGWAFLALSGCVVGALAGLVTAAGTVLVYLDLRVRREGLDIELAASPRAVSW